jgi:hemoglobin/transferrin/lactoferrin receptor protein
VDTLFIFTRRISGDLKVGGGDSIYQDDQDKKRNNFLGKFGYRFNPYSFLELTGEVFDDKTNTLFSTENLRGSAFETTTQILNEDRITQRQRVSLSYQFDNPADQSWLQFARASVYFQNAEIEENSRRAVVSRTGITRDEADKSFLDRVAGGILQFRSDFALGSTQHRFSYGITTSSTYNERNDLRYNTTRGDRLSLAGYPRKDFPDSRTFRLGVYLQNEITLGGAKVKLIPALRYDVYNVTVANNPEYLIKQETPTGFSSTALSPSLNLVYQATPNLSIFGRYSRGFRPPTYSELNTSFRADIPIRPHKGVPNPSLKAETSNNFEMGFRYSSNQFNLDFTGFYNRYKNFMEANALAGFDFGDVSFGVPFQVFQTRNVAEAEIYGLELKGSYRFSPNPGGVYLRGALGWQQGNDLTRNRPLPTVGPLQAVVGLGYRDPNDKWGIEAITTFVAQAREQENFVSVQSQTFRNPRPVIVNLYEPSGYTLLDVIGYVNITPNLTLTLGGYNMFNTSYYQYSDVRTIDTNSPIFEAQRGRYAQPGRNFAIGISWRF